MGSIIVAPASVNFYCETGVLQQINRRAEMLQSLQSQSPPAACPEQAACAVAFQMPPSEEFTVSIEH
jgi:hypothetical protein